MSATQLGFGFDGGALTVPEVPPCAPRKSVSDDGGRARLAAFVQKIKEHRDHGAFNRFCDDLRLVPWIGDCVFLRVTHQPDDPEDFRLRPMLLPEPSLTMRELKRGMRVHHDTRVLEALGDMRVRRMGALNDFHYLVNGLSRLASAYAPVRVYSVCVANLPDGRRQPVKPVIRAEDCKSARKLIGRVNSERRGDIVLAHLDALRDMYRIDHDRGKRAMVDAPTLALAEEVLGRDSTRVPF